MKALAALKEIYTREKNHTLEKRQDCIGRMEDVSRKLGNIKTGACDLLLHLENKKDNLPEEEKTLKKNILCLPFLSNILNLLAEPYDTRQSTESAGMKLYVFYNEIFKLSSRLQNEIIKALALL
ncbi:MAG TPA: hypothetical protein DC049_12145 [Spirochaetia bacterium]|nr:hypothetical protein [Spirochaetia bacterium]